DNRCRQLRGQLARDDLECLKPTLGADSDDGVERRFAAMSDSRHKPEPTPIAKARPIARATGSVSGPGHASPPPRRPWGLLSRTIVDERPSGRTATTQT